MVISEKDRRIAKAKIEGKKNKEIGAVEFPEATPESQSVLVSRSLKKPHVVQYLDKGKDLAIRESGLTWKSIIEPIKDGLQATKYASVAGDFFDTQLPDHAIRLKASDMASKLLGDEPNQVKDYDLENLDKDINEIELSKIVFKKT